MTSSMISNLTKLFEYYKMLGHRSMKKLDEEDLFWSFNETSNSIAIIVNHLHGNMLSRWTNFLTEDGEKSWRKRDLEFENIIKTKDELWSKWESGWTCLFQALDSISEEQLTDIVLIRNQKHTVIQAIQRQLAHYAYHVGQIVWIAKMRMDTNWTSLTIPKGKSKAYNEHKNQLGQHEGHFTDEWNRKELDDQ